MDVENLSWNFSFWLCFGLASVICGGNSRYFLPQCTVIKYKVISLPSSEGPDCGFQAPPDKNRATLQEEASQFPKRLRNEYEVFPPIFLTVCDS